MKHNQYTEALIKVLTDVTNVSIDGHKYIPNVALFIKMVEGYIKWYFLFIGFKKSSHGSAMDICVTNCYNFINNSAPNQNTNPRMAWGVYYRWDWGDLKVW